MVKSPAKLNLCLFVLGKRNDGFHEILSVVQKIDLCDIIEIRNADKNSVSFESDWEIPKNNTVFISLEYISSFTKNFYRVRIKKNIPPGAGLGGASSNAGTILNVFKNKIPEDKIWSIAEKIGSDVPLFLRKSPSVISGRGEIVSEISIGGLDSVIFLVVFPNITSITKDVYHRFDTINTDQDKRKLEILKDLINSAGVIKWDDFKNVLGYNDLETAFLQMYPEAKNVKEFLSRFAKFYLTGSGSSFFSVFFDEKEAERIYNILKQNFKFVWLVKTFKN